MLGRLRGNNKGMILITVIMVITVMTILTLTVVSQISSQTTSVDKQVEQIKADQYTKGAFWNVYSNLTSGTSSEPNTISDIIDNKIFTSGYATGSAGEIQITATY